MAAWQFARGGGDELPPVSEASLNGNDMLGLHQAEIGGATVHDCFCTDDGLLVATRNRPLERLRVLLEIADQ